MQDQQVDNLLIGFWWGNWDSASSTFSNWCGVHLLVVSPQLPSSICCRFYYLQIILKDMAQKRFVIWKNTFGVLANFCFFFLENSAVNFMGLRLGIHVSWGPLWTCQFSSPCSFQFASIASWAASPSPCPLMDVALLLSLLLQGGCYCLLLLISLMSQVP